VSRELARAAVSFARDRGARAIEGYPIITTDVIMEELLVGTVMPGVPLLVSSRRHRRPVVLVSLPTSRHSASRTDEPAIRFDRARVVKVRSHSHGRLVQPPFRRRGRRDRAPTIVSILYPSGCCHSFAERPYTLSNRVFARNRPMTPSTAIPIRATHDLRQGATTIATGTPGEITEMTGDPVTYTVTFWPSGLRGSTVVLTNLRRTDLREA